MPPPLTDYHNKLEMRFWCFKMPALKKVTPKRFIPSIDAFTENE